LYLKSIYRTIFAIPYIVLVEVIVVVAAVDVDDDEAGDDEQLMMVRDDDNTVGNTNAFGFVLRHTRINQRFFYIVSGIKNNLYAIYFLYRLRIGYKHTRFFISSPE
jgi:hypothetical protein